MKKVVSILLAAIIMISVLSAAFTASANAVNTALTAYPMALNEVKTYVFKYGYPTHTYEGGRVDEDTIYYSFTPTVSDYYEFEATGYNPAIYPTGQEPYISINVYDSTGNWVLGDSINKYTGVTKTAGYLYKDEKYTIKLYDSGVFNLYYYQEGDGYKYAEETINLALRKHSHTYDVTKYTYSSYVSATYRCRFCNYYKYGDFYKPTTITLSASTYAYDGKVKTPSVTVKDSKGKKISSSYYTVSYSSGRKKIGKYAVKVKFKKEYEEFGSLSTSFTIGPKGTSLSSVAGAKKAFTAKWKKQTSQVTGYQLQYATNSSFKSAKTVTIASNKTVSKKITKLAAKKTYYVRVRTYKTIGKTKYYSPWSAKKAVKTK